MNLLKISWKNVKSKPLDLTLSVTLLAFGVGIISLLLLLEKQLSEKFNRNIKDIDMVLGAKGSPLQLILANVYHIDAPTGNIKVSDAQKIIRNPTIKEAIPLAYGDNFEKFRIVGTTKRYPEHYNCELKEGKWFAQPFEATIGATVAEELGLKVGDTFESAHGLDAEKEEHDHTHDTPYTVVGIMKTSNSALDQLILTPVESVWLIHEHPEEEVADTSGTEMTSEPEREMTAYLLIKRTPMAQMILPKLIQDTNMQLALPAIEMNRLSQNFGLGMDAMKAIAVLIMVLSFISVFISLFNSLKARKYELALMRTMGGSRGSLFSLLLLEGTWLVVLGFLAGLFLSRLGLYALSEAMEENFHYSVADMSLQSSELVLFAVTLGVGIVASFLPAVRAFRMDISKTLSNG
jgi:putative ABC transport system permease protein